MTKKQMCQSCDGRMELPSNAVIQGRNLHRDIARQKPKEGIVIA